MNCPHCSSTKTTLRSRVTKQGYKTFHCKGCNRTFNERTNSPFNRLKAPTHLIFEVVLWRLRYKVSLRELCEMFLARGYELTHETIRSWQQHFGPLLAQQLKTKRKGQVTKKWHVDETLLKIKGVFYYVYRAIDNLGNLVDVRLSKVRDLEATEAFFKQAVQTVGHKPQQVTTDGEVSYPKAINKVLGHQVIHRVNQYLNNSLEQDHRGLKGRYYPMLGFGNEESAARFISAFEEQRQYFRFRQHKKEVVSLAERRQHFKRQFYQLRGIFTKFKVSAISSAIIS